MPQPPGYEPVPYDLPNERQHRQLMAVAINNTQAGKTNNRDTLTITANVATTTFSNSLIGYNSTVLLMPTTANAATALATTYIDTFLNGSCVVHHANNAQVDRIFKVVIIG